MNNYETHNVFISWSGTRSKRIAEELTSFLPRVIHVARPFFSNDIDKGNEWLSTLISKLNECSIGIVCLTSDNINKPWILFESGAIHKGSLKNKLCTLLIEVNRNDIKFPLKGFQDTILNNKLDLYKLMETINSSMDYSIPDEILRDSFDLQYDKFINKCREIINQTRGNQIDGDELIKQIDNVKDTIQMADNQLPQIREAINIYQNLQNQGVDNVYKCDSDSYYIEDAEIHKKIREAKCIRAFNHIGRKIFEIYEKDIIEAINQKNCQVEILIISNDLAGENIPILSKLCSRSKKDEVEDLEFVKERVHYIKQNIKSSSTGSITLKRYSFAPTGSILIIDEFVRFIPYLAGRQGDTSVALFGHKLENNEMVFDEFEKVFEEVWEKYSE